MQTYRTYTQTVKIPQAFCDATGPLQQQEVVAIALDILEGLVQLHDLHIFHQNLKPENVLFNDYGHAYLSDFGVDHTVEAHESSTSDISPYS